MAAVRPFRPEELVAVRGCGGKRWNSADAAHLLCPCTVPANLPNAVAGPVRRTQALASASNCS
eukprot:366239-Chlamydomonas_euryale.AAC.42